ncbi:MAG TPA: ATP-binding protein, partial [Candidatus Aquilonibacter sp.]|nr:ATP-binding protein [Candidatus Aquilonibacter sp.]
MNTRRKTESGPLSQSRYMSSPEFSELHGVSGVAVSARAAVLLTAEKKDFIWWLQGQSLAEGGLRRLAKELVEMFPDRLGTPQMHKAGVKPEKTYPGELVSGVEVNLNSRDVLLSDEPTKPEKGSLLIERCRAAAFKRRETPQQNQYLSHWQKVQSIEEFIIDLCINPRIHFAAPGDGVDVSDIETDKAIEENPDLSKCDFKTANLIYFREIVGALFEFKARREANTRKNFQLTAIGKKIWETLDYALASRGMVVLDGLEGRGKTEAVKAWCELHLGRARFVSLKGITTKTTAFREIARALGIASSYTRTAPEMQARIEDVLNRSKLLLVLDEAHFLFNQSRRMYSRPELLDWLDTAVVNRGVGCALCTTPQFIVCMTRAADQVDWNYRQFRRRVKRWIKLPAANTEEDIKAVAQNVFKKADAKTISKIVGYALLSKRDLSAVGDVAAEVRVMLGTDDLSGASVDHIHRAIYDFLLPSDKTFLEGMAAARQTGRKTFRKAAPVLPEEPAPEIAPAESLPPR